MDIQASMESFLSGVEMASVLRVAFLLFIALPMVFVVSGWVRSFAGKRYSGQQGMIFGKITFYSGVAIIVVVLFHELGFSLAPLLGAAGIIGIALGFASQTSVSNIISGVFLIAEKPFVVGDIITIGTTTGQVLTIDTLSVKIRTFDNRMVRIPNESIIKTEVTTATYFPIRRVDLNISVAYKEDIARVREILLDVARVNPLCLEEPEPLFVFSGFGSSSIDLMFAVWAQKTDFLKVKNSMLEEIKARFDAEGIEIPFPHLSLYSGLASEPLPIRVVGNE